jgi:hypothetical protein
MGASAGSATAERALMLSEMRMVALQFLVFLLRINFVKKRHFYKFRDELLPHGI